jgi:T4 RnlA family RNA ligase
MYPVINNISDLLPWIRGNDNFSVNYKPGYIVVDYILNTPDLFRNEWEKECRGIIFDANTGVVLSRPYHKFFNMNERPESVLDEDGHWFDKSHVVLEKLDGSMIRCFKVGDRWIWGSKAGETFLTPQIEEFVKDKPQYLELVKAWDDWTLIWEWCSRKNRIVVDHPRDRLVLTGMRHNVTGNYLSYAKMKENGEYGIEVVKEMSFNVNDVKVLDEDNFEGIVVRFDDGHMVKVKTDKYVRYHHAKDSITREKNVIAILVNNQADDFRSLLSPEDRQRFELFENDFFTEVGRMASYTQQTLSWYIRDGVTKKKFALELQKEHEPLTRRIFFKYLEGNDIPDKTVIYYDMINILRGKVNSQASVDEARQLFLVNWNDYSIGDNENET